jgi:hypothetical protein
MNINTALWLWCVFFVCTERNLNPKAACLKRREEEKTEELPGHLGPPPDLAQQVALGGPKVCPLDPPTPSQLYLHFKHNFLFLI